MFKVRLGWTDDEFTLWQTLLTTFTNIGAAFAALFAGSLIKYGKWRMLMLTNLGVMISSGICLIDNIYVILIGRTLFGASAGAFTVFCPKFRKTEDLKL